MASYNVSPAFLAAAPRERRTEPENPIGIVGRTGEVVRVDDLTQSERYRARNPATVVLVEAAGARTLVVVPMLRDGRPIGAISIYRKEVRPFGDRQVELLRNFASQAVIAIENARLFDETKEALERQTATSDILAVIASSTTDVRPVFRKVLATATRLCGAEFGIMNLVSGSMIRQAEFYNLPSSYTEAWRDKLYRPHPQSVMGTVARSKQTVYVDDIRGLPAYREGNSAVVALADTAGARSYVGVPMIRDDELIGMISIYRQEVRPFTAAQIELIKNFASQAVIAIENFRLLGELRQRTDDLSEALVYQTGSSNILKVIASSPTDVEPALKAIVESACEICEASDAIVCLSDGDSLVYNAHHGPIPVVLGRHAISRGFAAGRAIVDRAPVHIHDVLSEEGDEFPGAKEWSAVQGVRSLLSVPLMRDGESIGAILLRRTRVDPFSDKQIDLLETFADQAVIAISNVRLFEQVQERTRDLTESLQFQTATSDVLKVISRSPDTLQPVLDTIAETSHELCGCDGVSIYLLRDDRFHYAAVSGPMPKHVEHLRNNPAPINQPGSVFTRVAKQKRTLHYPNVADDAELMNGTTGLGGPRALLLVPLLQEDEFIGTIVLRQSADKAFTPRQIQAVETFADQAVIAISNVNLFEQVQARTRELAQSLDDLRATQDRLVQTEKLASLGQLTAGIAHEIKNPLNFVNNFSALSVELTEELNDVLRRAELVETVRKETDELTGMLKDNLSKIVQHGKRADSIVKNMLLHSREGSREQRPTDINALVEESLNLAYHGARAEKSGFEITLRRDLDANAGIVEVFPQEISRALLNLISNGFYAATKRKAEKSEVDVEPTVGATTKDLGGSVEIRIRDNGAGIPPEVRERMFNPFFTTKPTGEGTGLGLSITHDIIVKQHSGRIDVETSLGEYTEFIITLPRSNR